MKSNETDCILELRSTITLMEQSLRQLCARVEALEDCENYRQQDEDIERAIEPKLNSSLVERVGNKIPLLPDGRVDDASARAAIREVAIWLEEEFSPQIDWITTELREEADLG